VAFKDTLESSIDDILGTSFNERDGRVVPTTEDVKNNEAVKLDAVFLYADLAGSGELARHCPWDTTAKVIRAFLDASTRIIRVYGGEIRSFDGDRVMGVFLGDMKNTYATRAAREIFYATERLIGPKASKKFTSISSNNIKLKCGVGVDYGTGRAVRAGIRSNNDLIWIGRAPSMAAKLSDIRSYPHCVFIHEDVYKMLADSEKMDGSKNMWEKQSFNFAGAAHNIYRTNYFRTP